MWVLEATITVKALAVRSIANRDCRKFGRKNIGKLKPICMGNVMKIVKISKKHGELLLFAKFTKIFTANVFYCTVTTIYCSHCRDFVTISIIT